MTYHVYDLPPPDLSGLVMEEARVLPAARDLVHLGQDGEVPGSAALQQLQTFERFSSQAPKMVGGRGVPVSAALQHLHAASAESPVRLPRW